MNRLLYAAHVGLLALAVQAFAQQPGTVPAATKEKSAMPQAQVRVTSSWDDGHRNDIRVCEILRKYRAKGMAYPGGAYNPDVEAAVKKAGYVYARTVENAPTVFPAADPYALKVSLHVNSPQFWAEFERVKAAGGVFYLWGHSYEFRTEDDWKVFEEKVAKLSADPAVKWVTNGELFEPPQ